MFLFKNIYHLILCLLLAGCTAKPPAKAVRPALVVPPKQWSLTWDYNTNGVIFDIQQSTNLIDWLVVSTNLQWETNWLFNKDLPAKYFRLCVPKQ